DNRNRGNWRNFEEARAFVQNLGLKSEKQWRAYCRSGKKPNDIPAKPNRTYAESGWNSMGDWLGTGRRKSGSGLRFFEEARAFVQNLGLKSEKQWRAYCRSGKKPDDIPAKPSRTYAESGWISMGDWLGTGRRKSGSGLRSFEEAWAFVQSLGLKSAKDWRAYCRSGQKPDDIPAHPDRNYANSGWDGIGNWLGTGRRKRGNWRRFEEARAFVRSLGLECRADWETYCRSGKKPDDIPNAPANVYADAGWDGWGDWLEK